MSNLLLQHALDNIWCEPAQDYQSVISLARLTKNSVTRRVKVLLNDIVLPLPERQPYHVYQIGALPDDFFNLELSKNVWYLADELIEGFGVVIDLFFNNGCKIPTDYYYLRKNNDGNFIAAVKYIPKTDYLGKDLDRDIVYARFYANAYYDTTQWRSSNKFTPAPVKYIHADIFNAADLQQFLNDIAALSSEYDLSYGKGYIDGYAVHAFSAYNDAYYGKHFSFCIDASIKQVVFYTAADLPMFISDKDPNVIKYLLINGLDYTTIDYFDDNDVYAFFNDSGVSKGVYIGKLREETLRQVTHNTYSISKRVIEEYLARLNQLTTLQDLTLDGITLKLVVRQGGFLKGMVPQHNRIEELYKLSYGQVVDALINPTTVPEWGANVLENSDYIRVMGESYQFLHTTIGRDVVQNAYGYNAATKAIANPICNVVGAIPFAKLPSLLSTRDKITNQGRRVIYYYEDGLLKGFLNDSSINNIHYLTAPYLNSSFVEAFNATAVVMNSGAVYDTNVESHYLKQYGFRCYVCPIVLGQPSEVWYDVTDGPYYTYNPDGTTGNSNTPILEWNYTLLSAANLFPCVRINHTHYIFTPDSLTPNYQGFIQFQLEENALWFSSNVVKPLKLELGVIDVFMDEYSLVRNLDYFVEDGNKITIVKKPTTAPEDTVILVRGYGFPNPVTMAADLPREMDFVKGGILSVNGIYNIRNDRNIRTVVSGKVKLRDEVKYAENMAGSPTNDGRPYAISDYAVGVENFTSETLIPYRNEAIDLDNRVMDYLTSRLPEATVVHPVIEVAKWGLFSPFISAIIHAFETGFLNTGQLDTSYTDGQVDIWIAPYSHLLDVDPARRSIDLRYVIIYPHQYNTVIEVSSSQYRFLEYLIRRFLNGRVDLTPSIIIG